MRRGNWSRRCVIARTVADECEVGVPDIVHNTARAGSYGPYGRDVPMPRQLEDVTAGWLGGLMANRYPGLVIEAMETVDLHNSHTTNLRVAVEYNAVGKAAGLPAHLCLKANWSELTINNNTDICELEARFYRSEEHTSELQSLLRLSFSFFCFYK